MTHILGSGVGCRLPMNVEAQLELEFEEAFPNFEVDEDPTFDPYPDEDLADDEWLGNGFDSP